MALDISSAHINELHAAISTHGDERQREQADAIMAEYSTLTADLPVTREIIRNRMMSICASADWAAQFLPDAFGHKPVQSGEVGLY